MRNSAIAAAMAGSLMVAGLGISAAELKELRENGSIRIAVYRDFFPFSDQTGGRIQGIDLEVGRSVAKKLGLAVDVMGLTADESVSDDLRNAVWKGHYLGGGTADVMMHVPVDHGLAEENDEVRILAPYYREEIAIAYDPLRIPQLVSLEAFADEKIGVELETLSDSFLTAGLRGRLRGSVVHYTSTAAAAAALGRGEVAGVMGPRSVIEASLGEQAKHFAIVPFTIPMRDASVSGWNVGVALKGDDEDLAAAVEEVVAALREDGTIARIFRDYGVTYVPPLQE
jgi:polar amino acid transport system substrate-binding protein